MRAAALLVLVATNLVLVRWILVDAADRILPELSAELAAYAVEREPALSYALVLHALNSLPYLLVGYAALVLHTRALRRRSATVPR